MRAAAKKTVIGLAAFVIVLGAYVWAKTFTPSRESKKLSSTGLNKVASSQGKLGLRTPDAPGPGVNRATGSLEPKSALQTSAGGGSHATADTSGGRAEKNPAVVSYLKTQDYGSMSPVEINELLNLLTLGEGKNFLNNKDSFIVSLSEFEKANPGKTSFIEHLSGVYWSNFVESIPETDDRGYTIELRFEAKALTVSFMDNSRAYYQHVFGDIRQQLKIAKNPEVPANLFIELPVKPDYGYIHPLYLEVMVGSDMRSLIAVLYNSNQLQQTVSYLHAENLIFSKVN